MRKNNLLCSITATVQAIGDETIETEGAVEHLFILTAGLVEHLAQVLGCSADDILAHAIQMLVAREDYREGGC